MITKKQQIKNVSQNTFVFFNRQVIYLYSLEDSQLQVGEIESGLTKWR